MQLKEFVKGFLKKMVYGPKANSISYVKYLRSLGVKIGDRTAIYAPTKTLIDITRPWLIEIGEDVQITEGVTILTHGYDWAVLKGAYGDILGSAGKVSIGNNVFIGVHSTILKGVHIGNNVIIGANSLVNKDIPDNVVAAGNPCRVLMSLDEYHEKRKKAQIREAQEMARLYRERYNKEPDEEALHEFFWLFCDGKDKLPECWDNMMKLCGNYEMSRKRLAENQKQYNNFGAFLQSTKM